MEWPEEEASRCTGQQEMSVTEHVGEDLKAFECFRYRSMAGRCDLSKIRDSKEQVQLRRRI